MRQFIAARLLPGLVSGVSPLRQKVRTGCLLLASACLVIALARPQWGFSWQEVKQRGVDIVVAIDCSKSMLATDIAPNRLARAKLAALELMQKARTDRLGLVAFAGSAFLTCPLTIDDAAFGQSVEALDVDSVSQGGTAVSEAITAALTAFKEEENHKLLVLMTDGEDHDSGAVKAAEEAAKSGLRIYTIGIGTPEGELLRIRDAQGQPDYVRDEQGNVVKSHLNEDLLKTIASSTPGGFYLPLRGAATIDTLYREGLSSLPKSEHQEKFVKQYHERFHWPLSIAILLLAFETVLPQRRKSVRKKTQAATALTRAAAALFLVAVIPQAMGGASPGQALREYKAGNYGQAMKDYEQLLRKKGEDPQLRFNAGTAAYRNGQYRDAVKQFDQAIATPDLKLQESAYYNRGNSLFWLGEQAPDPAQRKENWQKALKDFELSSKLNPQDPDAKYNYDFVKKRLEELQQQQQQQQKSDQKNSDDQQQQQQQSEQSKQDQNQQQQSQQNQAQNQQSQAQQPQQTPQQQAQQRTNQQSQAEPAQPQTNNVPEQQQANAAEQQKEEAEKEQQDQAAAAAGQMTPEQARRLLDSEKGKEKMLSQKQQKPVDTSKRFKDW